ncbi:hypothetical protein [Bifidobacterium simiarum]|uniref:hypothetical protein n=1 Tax=Bifidobacterium simiarum TaxID=2045441 RepID=UPI001BDD8D4B|nr:hypothetical protein [Bifidobacterium simiarum]MBT1166891.1 hypothetical protein [Bifidobacterium simiarum]
MRIYKAIITALVCVALSISLAACGGTGDGSSASTSKNNASVDVDKMSDEELSKMADKCLPKFWAERDKQYEAAGHTLAQSAALPATKEVMQYLGTDCLPKWMHKNTDKIVEQMTGNQYQCPDFDTVGNDCEMASVAGYLGHSTATVRLMKDPGEEPLSFFRNATGMERSFKGDDDSPVINFSYTKTDYTDDHPNGIQQNYSIDAAVDTDGLLFSPPQDGIEPYVDIPGSEFDGLIVLDLNEDHIVLLFAYVSHFPHTYPDVNYLLELKKV